jgi:hypothetical protein
MVGAVEGQAQRRHVHQRLTVEAVELLVAGADLSTVLSQSPSVSAWRSLSLSETQ